ncbi:Intercellular adhesion molecule 3 [Saguinus oedipus]|uniref:Intercellular adhesion molecule 3 n=1 Tax=Saguinus oedipus TaxID=9490 RepID=A0ABQ9TRR4_SAGOE|nr:Intercellular adhesion molecule 3 [Saguinus oedipus]
MPSGQLTGQIYPGRAREAGVLQTGGRILTSRFLCTARNSNFVPVLLAVLTTLGVVTVIVALMYVFRARKQRGLYHVRQESPSLPLTSMPTEAMREEPSRVE